MTRDNFMLDNEMTIDHNENLFAFVCCDLGSFELACEDLDEVFDDSKRLLELWQLKDPSVTDVVVQVFSPRTDGSNDSRSYRVLADKTVRLG